MARSLLLRKLLFLVVAAYCTASTSAQMKLEGVKFFVHKNQQSDTVRLYRVLLKTGLHFYAVTEKEVREIKASPDFDKVEDMDAFVFTEQSKETVELRCFLLSDVNRHDSMLMTAFEPEANEVASFKGASIKPLNVFVFPHTFVPSKEQAGSIVPMYSFYNEASGEHFYTTSENEKEMLVKASEQKLTSCTDRYVKLRNKKPTAVGGIGDSIKIGDVSWSVLEAKLLGDTLKSGNDFIDDLKTSGTFLQIEIRIENTGQNPLTIIAPQVFDEKGRMFSRSSDAIFHVPKEKNIGLIKNINPGVSASVVVVYDIPKDAVGLTLLVGDLELLKGKEGALDLGL